jgi:hypothetical protein
MLLVPVIAQADWHTLYQTGFDGDSYIAGNTINGVDGWSVTVNDTLSTVQSEPVPPTNQFNYINGASTFNTYRQLPYAITSGRVRLSYTWTMIQDDVNSNNTAYGLWAMLTKTSDPVTNRAGMIGGTFDPNAGEGTFRAFDSTTGAGWTSFGTFALNTSYQLAMDIDMTTKTYDVYLNGDKMLSNLLFYTSNLDSVDYVQFYRRYKSGYYGIDNVKIETTLVPEPSTLVALLCGLSGITGIIRRRK